MIVVKLGGSLMDDPSILRNWLDVIEQKSREKVVIVPGGGIFADQVRSTQKQWKFDDETAHQMAILAMRQMALLLKSIKPSFVLAENVSSISEALSQHSFIIWSPDIIELNYHAIKPGWSISSDSLAAWLAGQLSAKELILVKSANIPRQSNIEQMQSQGVVDKAFGQFTTHATYKITLINKHEFNEYFLI